MLVPHLLKIDFGLGWPLSVLVIVSARKIKKNCLSFFFKNKKFEYFIELGYGTQRYSETAEAFEELNPEQQQQVYPTIMNVI